MLKTKWLLILTLMFSMFTGFQSTQAASVSEGKQLIKTANRYLGTPYLLGAPYGTTRVFDCSSFTKYVFAKNGIRLPRVSHQQARVGHYVPKSKLRIGDLIFFSTPRDRGISHVGIYAGKGKFIHTFGEPKGVTYSSLNNSWWKSHYITARRVG